jgi:hypothetical protein
MYFRALLCLVSQAEMTNTLDGDRITVDAQSRSIIWHVSPEVAAERKKAWDGRNKNELKVRRGVLYRYARDVAVSVLYARLPVIEELTSHLAIAC